MSCKICKDNSIKYSCYGSCAFYNAHKPMQYCHCSIKEIYHVSCLQEKREKDLRDEPLTLYELLRFNPSFGCISCENPYVLERQTFRFYAKVIFYLMLYCVYVSWAIHEGLWWFVLCWCIVAANLIKADVTQSYVYFSKPKPVMMSV